jgi:hypothetical protein
MLAVQAGAAGGLAVITQLAAVSGAVQIAVALGSGPRKTGLIVPAFAVHTAGTDEVISTCSSTPTFVRVSGEPSGAALNVRVVIVQTTAGAGAGAAGAGAGARAGSAWDTGPGISSSV